MSIYVLRSAGSTVGMLQRGRGAGWLRAAQDAPAGRTALLECLKRDPRWDRQVESRSDYYATLSLEVGVSADVLARLLESLDADLVSLVESILVERARRGDTDAFAHLERRPRTSVHLEAGVAGDSPSTPPPPPVDSSIERILDHEWSGPWPRWLLHRFRGKLTDREVTLLREAAVGPFGARRRVALRALAERADPHALELAADLFARDVRGGERGSAFAYVRALNGSDTLALAREWITYDDDRAGVAAELLAIHGEQGDVPAIRVAMAKAWSGREMYALCSLIQALGRQPAMGPFPELNDVFEQVEYSYARRRAAHALAATAPDFADRFALECLWDCEADTRSVGAAAVHSRDPRASSRLAEIADDLYEDDETRVAARSALVV